MISQGSYTPSLFSIAQGDAGLLKETYQSRHDDDDDDNQIVDDDMQSMKIKSFTEERLFLTVMI